MKSKVLLPALAAGIAASALLTAAPASAAILFSFSPGTASPAGGYTVIDDFDGIALATLSGTFQIKQPPHDSDGAPPANSVPTGTHYLSVLGGQTADIAFGGTYSTFEFDWGSIDTYNTLVIHSTGGDLTIHPGFNPGDNFANDANGDQMAAGTNGLFRVTGSANERFTGITLSSDSNSFEIDNVAVKGGVPEPASWALMILGVGMTGGLMRAKRRTQAFA